MKGTDLFEIDDIIKKSMHLSNKKTYYDLGYPFNIDNMPSVRSLQNKNNRSNHINLVHTVKNKQKKLRKLRKTILIVMA